MGLSPNDLRMIADALLLAFQLVRNLTKDSVARVLAEPLAIDELPELPSWLLVKNFIESHPEILDSDEKRAWWRDSDRGSAARVRLIREFGAAITGRRPQRICLLNAGAQENPEVMHRILGRFDRILDVLRNAALKSDGRRTRIVSILSGPEA